MKTWLKACLKKYDSWCKELGLTPENKRSCVPYRSEPPKSSSNIEPKNIKNKK